MQAAALPGLAQRFEPTQVAGCLAGHLPLFCIARSAGARSFHGEQGFRTIGGSDGADMEEAEPVPPCAAAPTPKHGETQ
jgi:hypothetical protein